MTEQKSMFYRLYLLSKQSKATLSLYTSTILVLDGLGFKSLNLATYLKSQRHELLGIIDKYGFFTSSHSLVNLLLELQI